MTPKQEKRLDELEDLLADPEHAQDPRLWQERLELLRVIDRANAPKETTGP